MSYSIDELKMLNDMFSSRAWELYKERTINPLIQMAIKKSMYDPTSNPGREVSIYWSAVYYFANLLIQTPENILGQVREFYRNQNSGSDNATPWE